MQRTLLLAAAVLAAVAIEAIWLAPAALVDARVAHWTRGTLRIAATDGTLWRGRGVLVAGTAQVPIGWRIDAWPLLRGELRAQLLPDEAAAPAGSPRADVAVAGSRIVLRDVDVTVPAALFVNAAGPASVATLTLAGDARITTASLDWSPPLARGDAQLAWRGARLGLAGGAAPVDLGDLRATLTADGDRLAGPVFNAGGEVEVRGELAVQANQALRVSLSLAPRRPADAGLARTLAAIGAPAADGWRVEWRVPLP